MIPLTAPPSTSAYKYPAEAIKWYRRAAKQGYAPAEYDLGLLYLDSSGVRPELGEALRWLTQAADHGFATAKNQLGLLYERGQGVAQNCGTAAKWYRMAAEDGLAEARHNLALLDSNHCVHENSARSSHPGSAGSTSGGSGLIDSREQRKGVSLVP